MPVKKSELYSKIWESCDQLRGGMDASQYKDYVLVLLFMKYVSDKKDALVEIPEGGSFKDMCQAKGKADIGNKINTIIGKFAAANDLTGILNNIADFDNDDKLGKGKDKVDRLTRLIEIFETPLLDFSQNRVDGDDILGDAYEYLMRNFAAESGKSKGQFYTPAEVSRVMAKIVGIGNAVNPSQTLYDPTCGSGSLLLRAAEEAPAGITIYGQENENATRALAVMNMWLHNNPTSEIVQGNTLAAPAFRDEKTGGLKTFDFAVANPPFSYKSWANGLDPYNDEFKRFDGYDNIPPQKNGDLAFLLHFIKSLKSTGKGVIVMPLGVLFRGNAEGDIRRNIIQRGYIKGIIGLPANLFFGTGIAASLVIIDKEGAPQRKGIFMIDASKEFIKDGNKNRLRERDIHKIVDTFNNFIEVDKYSRMIPLSEIADARNNFNLNIPRYIDSSEPEDLQDIAAHLSGGIPAADVDALQKYWDVYPSMQKVLFKRSRPGYYDIRVPKENIKAVIFDHPEFIAFGTTMKRLFTRWVNSVETELLVLDTGCYPKKVIAGIAESLLTAYAKAKLTDKYAVYQHLMDYWSETMQDDMYELSADGWAAGKELKRITRITKTGGKETTKEVTGIDGLEGRLIPVSLIISELFGDDQKMLDDLEAESEALKARMDELREEHGAEDGLLANAIDEKLKINKKSLSAAIRSLGARTADNAAEYDMLLGYRTLLDEDAAVQENIKAAKVQLETYVINMYEELTIEQVQELVVEKKWLSSIRERISTEMDNISHRLTRRVNELAERYEVPLPQMTAEVSALEKKVNKHLKKMGFEWN